MVRRSGRSVGWQKSKEWQVTYARPNLEVVDHSSIGRDNKAHDLINPIFSGKSQDVN